MDSNTKGEGPLTILTLCDRLQELLVDNGMEDLPVYYYDQVTNDGGAFEQYVYHIPSVVTLPGTDIKAVVI